MGVILNSLQSSAISALNLGARVLKPVINYAQKEKDVFLKTNLTRDGKKTVEQLAKEQGKSVVKYSASLGAVLSTLNGVWMSGFYIWNNNRSKEIPEERKKTLNINIIITAVLALGLGFVLNPTMGHFTRALQSKVSGKKILKNLSSENVGKIIEKIKTDDNLINKAVKSMPELAKKPVKEIAEKYAPAYVENITKEGIRSIVDLLYITAAFRFAGPVLATPLAEMTNKFMAKYNLAKTPDKADKFNKSSILSSQEFFKLPNSEKMKSFIS